MSDDRWDDLFLRTDLDGTGGSNEADGTGTGTGPGAGEAVIVIGSPDLLATGIEPVDPAPYATEQSYDRKEHPQEPFRQHEPNYVYVRAKNGSPDRAVTGTVRLVMCRPGNVVWPGGDGWTVLTTADDDDWSELKDVAPGGIGITGRRAQGSEPFLVIPGTPGEHNLVAWISTPQHPEPDPPPRIATTAEVVEWLAEHPNYAQQTVTVAGATGVESHRVPFASGNRRAPWRFTLTAREAEGYTVSFSCGKQLQDGRFIRLEPVTVDTNDPTPFVIERTVEAGFSADIVSTCDRNGSPVRPGSQIGLFASPTPPPGDGDGDADGDSAPGRVMRPSPPEGSRKPQPIP